MDENHSECKNIDHKDLEIFKVMSKNYNPPKIIRIAVIGPESTGKSWLCEKLAEHYHTLWIPEYSRIFLSDLEHDYNMTDVIEIYTKQFQTEEEAIHHANDLIFIDTEFIIGKVWCEHVFKSSPEYFEKMINDFPYDLYLLTSPDLPWEYDPLRENPGKGDFFYNWYKEILDTRKMHYGIVSGLGQDRLNCAINIIEEFKKNNLKLHS